MPLVGATQPMHLLFTLVVVFAVFGVGKLGQVLRNLIDRSG
jgi:Sec-independent protein translocase protein TatA